MSSKEGRCLGLIGGLGAAATIHYYRELIATHEAQGRVARRQIAHADINRARYLTELIESMAAGGAELTAMVAITTHICAP